MLVKPELLKGLLCTFVFLGFQIELFFSLYFKGKFRKSFRIYHQVQFPELDHCRLLLFRLFNQAEFPDLSLRFEDGDYIGSLQDPNRQNQILRLLLLRYHNIHLLVHLTNIQSPYVFGLHVP